MSLSIKDSLIVFIIVGLMSLVANWVGYSNGIIESMPGMSILIAIALIGMMMARVLPGGIPAVAYVVTLACVLTYPSIPGASVINEYVAKVNFVSLTTPILAYAGIAIGKDLDEFSKTGWRIIVLACIVFTGTFLLSAIIAEFSLRYLGQI